jgi:hypothetical protein
VSALLTVSFNPNNQQCVCTYIGFEVLIAVVMKSSVFWDVMQCSSLKLE